MRNFGPRRGWRCSGLLDNRSNRARRRGESTEKSGGGGYEGVLVGEEKQHHVRNIRYTPPLLTFPAAQARHLLDAGDAVPIVNLPTGQLRQTEDEIAPTEVEYFPKAQLEQIREPLPATYMPASQEVHVGCPVIAVKAPGGQSTQVAANDAARAAEAFPARQSTQTVCAVNVWYLPAVQAAHAEDELLLTPVPNLPVAHGLQVAAPASLKCPCPQVAHDDCSVSGLAVPPAQERHCGEFAGL